MTSYDRRHRVRLSRGRRIWNLTSGLHGSMNDRLGAPLHELALRHLRLESGESVLDVGCGAGATLASLRAAVGPSGRVVGVDYSPRMLARAAAVVRGNGWQNVELRRMDASREPPGHTEFDAAIALTSLSAMPDVPVAVRLVHDALRPGGRLFVFDMRLVPSGGARTRAITRLFRLIYRVTAGFTGADVRRELERTFGTVESVVPDLPGRTRMTLLLATKAAQVDDRAPSADGAGLRGAGRGVAAEEEVEPVVDDPQGALGAIGVEHGTDHQPVGEGEQRAGL